MPVLLTRPIARLSSIRSFHTIPSRCQTAPTRISYTPTCPSPTCACAPMPPDLDIDHKTPLLNTMAAYTEQVVVCTGQDDWTSRVEDEPSTGGDFVRGVKGEIGKGGPAFDPFNNVLTTLSSLPNSKTPNITTALLFPSFVRIPSIPHSPSSFSAFASAFLKARTLHPAHSGLSEAQKKALTRDESQASKLPAAKPIDNVTVLICGHGGRDKRCGILGPILRSQFKEELERKEVKADVGLISHIGGHKYAGNVIVYIPPSMSGNALSGMGIWYGRVEPAKVEGIIEETVFRGRIISELFRGGITKEGASLGRMLEEPMKRERGETGRLQLKPKSRT